eukprot:NODE_683_length_5225_cov_0.594616.p1 type:complete len:534 gc:universal NODE_683_length_5225_cov_0.594616:2832-1231(-)
MTGVDTKQRLIIFDTTLRDGEQSPGVTLDKAEKIRIAKQLSFLGVDVCEAGFPVASGGDFESVAAIAETVGPLMENRKEPMTICALARATDRDILTAYNAIKSAPKKRIHTFLATSDLHLEYKLKISRDECITRAVHAVEYAKSLVDDVEFSCEDAARSDKDFLCALLNLVIRAGATTVNIPDTVGYMTPAQYGELIAYLIKNTANSSSVIWSCHCHDDLGLATANTIAGISSGARQVEVTVNGIGERAGNTALEEIAMILCVHSLNVFCNINTRQLYATSQLVLTLTGMQVQSNKAIIGKNAFAHESGIHQDGMLKHSGTYEIINPEAVGIPKNNIVLGKHSGRNALKARVADLGYVLDEAEINSIFVRFKKLADHKKNINDDDLISLLTGGESVDAYTLKSLQIVAGTSALSTVSLELTKVGSADVIADAAVSRNGALSAIFTCIDRITAIDDIKVELESYQVHSITQGGDSIGQVSLKVRAVVNGKSIIVGGHATDVDVLIASANAYIKAISRVKTARDGNGVRELSNEI